MQAWKLTAPKKIELVTQDPTPLQPNTVKVKIEKALLSQYEVNLFNNPPAKLPLPFVMGRYGVGVVSVTAEESGFNKADRVVINPVMSCGQCLHCKKNNFKKCENLSFFGKDIDGLYRDFIDLPTTALFKIPEIVPFEKALYVGQISLCVNILDTLSVEKGDHVAIYSQSKLGLILSQLVSYYGAIPILIDTDEESLQTARDNGTFYTFNPTINDNIPQDLLNITSGRMCEKVIYFSESTFTLNDCVNACGYDGVICSVLHSDKDEQINIGAFVDKNLSLLSVNNPNGNFPTAINLIATNKVNTSCLTSGEIKFNDLSKQLAKITTAQTNHKSVIINID